MDQIKEIISELSEHKATDIKVYSDINTYQYMIVASGNSERHTKALATIIAAMCKKQYQIIPKIEGIGMQQWVCVSMGYCLIHIFVEEARLEFNLDELWKDKMIDI
ncbi:MAG: ribosome silencing factor [Anaplasmataceae bacterium]|nr:ribosome silencing factor [Anaplasmataceae bacterium]